MLIRVTFVRRFVSMRGVAAGEAGEWTIAVDMRNVPARGDVVHLGVDYEVEHCRWFPGADAMAEVRLRAAPVPPDRLTDEQKRELTSGGWTPVMETP